MARRLLADLAFARAGDKGDTSDLSLFVRRGPDAESVYDVLLAQVTARRVGAHLGEYVTGAVARYEVRNVLALKFVCEGALGGGGPSSLRADNLGKALGGALLRLTVDLPDDLERRLGPRPAPPRDPYAEAAWRVADG
jgi:hypothetical protein